MNKKNKLLLTLSLAFVGSVLVAGCDLYGNGEKYTVSFETNGGTAVQSITYDWGKEVVLPANPTRTGYTFAGWYQDEYCTIPFEGISKINQDVKLYAAWTVNQYTVSFNSKGGSEISPITDNFGTKLTVTKPTLDGYTFAGWYLEESLTNTWNGTVLGKDTTVYAKWDANTVTFRFSNNASNAQGEMANQKFKTGEEGNKLRANAYTRSGYTFKGWATSENGEIAYQNENSISSIIGSDLSGKTITLYAIWEANKYDVTFSVGNEQVSKKQLAYGSEIEYPQTNPSKDGYEFTGWGVYAKTADTTFDGSKVYYDNVGTELEPVYQVAIVTENASISGNYYEIVPYTANVVPLNGINLYARFIRNRYQVTYNTNGGEEIATANMFYGSSLFLPTPTKAGYTFAGWFEDEELSTAFTGVNVPSRNLTLYAKWNASNCSVNFNTNGGSTIDTVNGLFGTNFVRPEDPTRAGYTFMGWYKDAELTNEYVFDKFDGNRTLYAKWDINQYTITFEENGGNEVTNITGDYNTSISEPTRPTRLGYEFAGWYKDAKFTEAYAFTKLTEDITLYAKWEANEYTITFEENGGSNVTNIVAAYDASIVAPTNPTRVGYSFGGWYSDFELQNAYTFDKMPLNGMTLYAKWNPNTNTAYVVKHQKETLSGTFEDADVEDLTGSTEALTEAAAKEYTGFELQSTISQVVIAGDGSTVVVVKYVRKTYNVAFVDADDPTKVLKVVSVKYGGTIGTIPTDIHKEGNKEEYKVGSETFNASTVIEDDTTVTVKFIAVGLGIIFTDDSATDITEIEEGATIPTIQNPSRTGYEFGGWLDNNGDAFTFPSTMPDHTIEVHAKWDVITYVIEFDSNEGSAVSNIVADYDASITAPENPTREGYTFGGWFTDDDTFANQYSIGTKMTNVNDDSTHKLVLHAKWTINQYTITFEEDGGSEVTNITQDYNSTVVAPTSPTKQGHTFAGWYSDEACQNEYVFDKMPLDGITLYAKWNINQYTITFEENGGSEVTNITQDYNSTVTQPSDPTRTGYTFAGWYSNEELTSAYVFGQLKQDATVYAKWQANEYNVLYELNDGSQGAGAPNHYVYDADTTLVAPTKLGNTFEGWYLESDFSGTAITKLDKETYTSNITLYAKWSRNTYTIAFETNGGSSVTSRQGLFGDEYEAVANPTKATDDSYMYTFAGWYKDTELTQYYGTNISGTIPATDNATNTLTLYAKWDKASYTIKFMNKAGGEEIYSREANGTTPYFEEYAYNLYRDTVTYQFINNGIQQAILYGSTEGASGNQIYVGILIQYAADVIMNPNRDFTTNPIVVDEFYNYAASLANIGVDYVKYAENSGNEQLIALKAISQQCFNNYSQLNYEDDGAYLLAITRFAKDENTIAELHDQIDTALSSVMPNASTYVKGSIDKVNNNSDASEYNIVQKYFTYLLTGGYPATNADFFNNSNYIDDYNKKSNSERNEIASTAYNGLMIFGGVLFNDQIQEEEKALIRGYMLSACRFTDNQESPAVETSDRLVTAISAFNLYKANAYQPIKEGSQFDGWTISYDTTNHIKYYNAIWASKVDTPVNINVNEIKAHSVEFTWEEVVGAGAYLVSYKVNDGEWQENIEVSQAKYVITGINNGDTVKFKVKATGHDANGDRRDNSSGLSYQGTTGIETFDTVSSVAAISLVSDSSTVVTYNHVTTAEADIAGVGDYYYVDTENKLYLFTSTAYSFANVKYIKVQTSSSQSTVVYDTETSKYKLVTSSGSENIFFEIYKQATGTAEDGKKYYSINGTEGDLSRTVEEVNVTVGDDVTAYYTLDVKEAYVKVLPESIGYGDEITEYRQNVQGITATASEDNKNKLYQNTTIETYKVGYSTKVGNSALAAGDYSATIETENYYNGVNLGFVVNTQLGTKLDASMFDFEYKVQGKNGDNWVDLENDDVFVYDEDTGVIYFKDVSYTFSGDTPTFVSSNDATYADGSKLFKLIVSPRADNPTKNYVNLGLPKAYKDSNKISSVEFEVEVINAVNVYSNESLKKAYANTSTEGICILSDIEAKLDANQIGYIDYVKTGLYGQAAIEKPEARGELEIVDGSAIMSTTYDGPKVWKQVDSKPAEGFSFKGKGVDGEYHYYYYDLNGDYVIKEAKWETNYSSTGGHFKIICGTCSDIGPGGFYTRVTNSNLKLGNIYQRFSTSDIDDITVHGNYYTVDGSNLPYIVSTTHVDIEGVIAAYEIQSVAVGIFGNFSESTATFNNLTVIANTKDASSFLNGNSGDTTSIAEYMSRTSGGYNGFRSMPMDVYYRNWCEEVKTKQTTATYPELIDTKCSLVLNNVNVYNTLIALYTDYRSNITASYCHVKQTWANSLYAHGADDIIVSKSCIEESGGAAYSVEDVIYIVTDYEGNVSGHDPINPQVNIEFSNVSTSNFVSGEEQWFKAYSMEVLALGMKSKVNSAVSGLGFTVLQTVTDPNTGLATEKMNLVYLTLNDHIDQSAAMKAQDVFKTDIDPDLVFGIKQDLSDEQKAALSIPTGFDLYVNPTTGTQQVVSIMSVSGNTIYVVANPTTGEIHKYLYFTYDMGSYTLSAMMELFDAK